MPASWSVVARSGDGLWLADLDDDGVELGRTPWDAAHAAELVAERRKTRWVWADASRTYLPVVFAGVRVERAWDLRLCRRILRIALDPDARGMLGPLDDWDGDAPPPTQDGLFAIDRGHVPVLEAVIDELRLQRAVIERAPDPSRLTLLLHGESAGALIAQELHVAGLPWNEQVHRRILADVLGERRTAHAVPERMGELADQVRVLLDDAALQVDSPPKVLRALRRAGIRVSSTSRWELAEQQHPVIEPLLAYKRLARLYTANGWAWLDDWVRQGRFRPVYVPGGVVTGRWASSGGGALQIPKLLRPAVVPDPGWVIIDADVAQLEPRALAGMSRDLALASAARGRDLYTGIVESGAVSTRQDAKYAMLGAMYGATSGTGGRLVPRLRKTYPTAMALVDGAAALGEQGGTVQTWLGRASPPPDAEWLLLASAAAADGAAPSLRDQARRARGDRGRFTRNFVVQGTAAEWALCWLAEIRTRLWDLGTHDGAPAERSGAAFSTRPHLVFFLHDEVMVHAPAALADEVAAIVSDAAAAAGRRMFGSFPIDFPLDVRVVREARL